MINRLSHFEKSHQNIYVVSWNLGNLCNYRCSYCPDDLHNGKAKFPSMESIVNFAQYLKDNIQKKIFLEFTGGEVTLHPQFVSIVKELNKRGFDIGIISNGSKPLPFWDECASSLKHVCLSFHPEFANFEKFKQVVNFLKDKTTLHLNFMVKPGEAMDIVNLVEGISDSEPTFSVEIQPLIDYESNDKRETIVYSSEEIEILKNFDFAKYNPGPNSYSYRGAMDVQFDDADSQVMTASKIMSNDLNHFSGMHCNAGLESMVIDFHGFIYRAKCNEGGKLGHINFRPIKIPQESIICQKQNCHCNFDICLTKYK